MNITILKDGRSMGPYSIESLRTALRAGDFLSTDLAWMPGFADWIPLSQFPGLAKTSPPPPLFSLGSRPQAVIGKASLRQYWLGYTISLSLLTAFYYLTQLVDVSSTSIGSTCHLMLWGSFIGAGFSSNVILYKSWLRLAADNPPISAQQAWILMLVPLFNLYWQFRAIYGLAIFVNQVAERESCLRRSQSTFLLASCVLACSLVIPGFEFLILLPFSVLSILGFLSVIETLEVIRPSKG